MGDRIASSVLASALLKMAGSEGGFGAVLAKGDADSGAILVVLAERGRRVQIVERLLQPNGDYVWSNTTPGGGNADGFDKFLERRRRFDPDMWILELDTASAERFAAEMSALD
jgi:hypothetical protein